MNTNATEASPDVTVPPAPPVPSHSPPATCHSPSSSVEFPRASGETPRACAAFTAYFAFGSGHTLAAVADQLGEPINTVKGWSSRFRWSDRISDFHAGLLRQQVEAQLAVHREHAEEWARRTRDCREQEWETAQKLRAAAQCYLETVGDTQLEKMTLAQASRALQIAARLARQALSDAALPESTVQAPIQLEMEAALQKAYGASATPEPPAPKP